MYTLLAFMSDNFIEDGSTIGDTQYTPWRHFADTAETSNQLGGFVDFVASLEERYVSGSGTANYVAGENDRIERLLESHPAIAESIDNIIRLPTIDDYPLWQVRCKVLITVPLFMSYSSTFSSSIGRIGRECCNFVASDGTTMAQNTIRLHD
jgi:hypothetical protein